MNWNEGITFLSVVHNSVVNFKYNNWSNNGYADETLLKNKNGMAAR